MKLSNVVGNFNQLLNAKKQIIVNMRQIKIITIKILILFFISFIAKANESVEKCLLDQIKNAKDNLTVAELKKICNETHTPTKKITQSDPSASLPTQDTNTNLGPISKRTLKERRTEFDPYVITPHRMNYVLPILSTNNINKAAYSSFDGYEENLEKIESKFQLSLKTPLNYDHILIENDALYFGFTLEAWWQVYADNISRPFRETNYRPEIFYLAPLGWHPFDGNTGLILGIEHQSNGRAQPISRSWNRVYLNFLYEVDNFAFSLQPWWRISEDDKEFPLDSDGDDNPNILDFMGHFELGMVYKWEHYELSFKGRQNFSTSNGAAEIGFTFPLWGKLRGYATAFSGYGESLIDYNHKQTRFGVGIALNNVL